MEPYEQLAAYSRHRESELRPMFGPAIDVTDAYGRVLIRVVNVLGTVPPQDARDATLRDLLADTFDFLYEWRRPLLEGRAHMAFPIGRRAYESLSLLAAASQNPALAAKWQKGREIKNEEIRKALATAPHPESEDSLRAMYKFFSLGAHPNRTLVAERYLGDGNEFVLGAIGHPNFLLTLEHFRHLVSCWFWFAAVVGSNWKEILRERDSEFGPAYSAVASTVREVQEWNRTNFNALLLEAQSVAPSK